jgi:hypothetical protein
MRLWLAAFASLTLAGCAHSRSAPPTTSPAVARPAPPADPAAAVVAAQVAAYNRRDLDAFAAFYSENVIIFDFPNQPHLTGLAALRDSYAKLFAKVSKLEATVDQSIVQGHYVITRETVELVMAGKTRRLPPVTVIYQVDDGKIVNVWFVS